VNEVDDLCLCDLCVLYVLSSKLCVYRIGLLVQGSVLLRSVS
jgi:hypothetical protein